MLMTKRKPASVGEILVDEFIEPLGLTQGDLAEAMGVPRKHVNELCNDRRAITADTALMLARVFGNSADFWLNVQRRNDLWEALHSPERRQRIERARPCARPPHEDGPKVQRRRSATPSSVHIQLKSQPAVGDAASCRAAPFSSNLSHATSFRVPSPIWRPGAASCCRASVPARRESSVVPIQALLDDGPLFIR